MDNPFLAPGGQPGNVVLDLDGVVFLGREVVPGAGKTMSALAAAGWNVLFATNNGTRSIEAIAERIERETGYVPEPADIVSSGLAATGMLGEADQPVYLVGEPGLEATVRANDIETTAEASEAATVIVALDRRFTYERLAAASGAIRRGARFIATNTDRTFPTPAGEVPGAGSLVAAVVAASGRDPEVAGKPHPPMVEAVRARLGPGMTWMIGDRPETDIAFARAGGWRSILTLSGVTTDPDAVPGHLTPDVVVASLADLGQ